MNSSVIETSQAEDRLRLWRDSPADFIWDVLGCRLTDQQREVIDALVNNKRVAVRSGNGLGKTHLAACTILWFLYTRESFILSTGPTASHVRTHLWGNVRKLWNASRIPLGGELLTTAIRLAPYWEAQGIATNDPSNFQGGHAENLLLIFDEAQAVDPEFWEAAESMMSGKNARWLVIGNPLEAKGEFYRAFRRPEEWASVTLSALDHPNYKTKDEIIPGATTYEWVEDRRQGWGEDDPRFIARVLGEFPEAGDDRVVPIGFLDRCADGDACEEGEGVHLGVDVARFGSDETVISVVKDNVLLEEIKLANLDGNEVSGHVIKVAQKNGIGRSSAMRIHVDVIGIGASAVDALKDSGWKVDSVDFSNKQRGIYGEECGPMEFANLRAEMYWAARELLRLKKACVPRKFGTTWEELTEGGYSYDRKGRLLVEPKKDIKKRLGRSPDGADAFVLSLARNRRRVPQIYI